MDCDRDSLIYLSEPIGPACHTNAPTCYFTELSLGDAGLAAAGSHTSRDHAPATTLFALERTVAQRRAKAAAGAATGAKPSWTARLLADPDLLCKKVREEAGELCETWENSEGARERGGARGVVIRVAGGGGGEAVCVSGVYMSGSPGVFDRLRCTAAAPGPCRRQGAGCV